LEKTRSGENGELHPVTSLEGTGSSEAYVPPIISFDAVPQNGPPTTPAYDAMAHIRSVDWSQ